MNAFTVRQRQALRYSSIRHAGDHEVRAEAPVESSTPELQRWFERAGWFLAILIGLALLALSACSSPEAVRRRNTPDPVPTCIQGRQMQQVGTYGPEKVPVVVATYRPCKRHPK